MTSTAPAPVAAPPSTRAGARRGSVPGLLALVALLVLAALLTAIFGLEADMLPDPRIGLPIVVPTLSAATAVAAYA